MVESFVAFPEYLNQNLHWKLGRLAPSFGIILACLETTAKKIFFFRNKTFLFFKLESWNFQQLFKNEFRETSQSFNSLSSFRQLLLTVFFLVVWLSWNFLVIVKVLIQPIDIFKAKPNAEYLECQGSGLWNEVLFANIVAMVLLD